MPTHSHRKGLKKREEKTAIKEPDSEMVWRGFTAIIMMKLGVEMVQIRMEDLDKVSTRFPDDLLPSVSLELVEDTLEITLRPRNEIQPLRIQWDSEQQRIMPVQ